MWGMSHPKRRKFDAALLERLLGDFVAELKPMAHDPRLDDLRQVLTLVDGTWLTALPRMARWALWQEDRRDKRGAKAHVQFAVLKGVPVRATITDAHTSEAGVLKAHLGPGRLYVLDRGCAETTSTPSPPRPTSTALRNAYPSPSASAPQIGARFTAWPQSLRNRHGCCAGPGQPETRRPEMPWFPGEAADGQPLPSGRRCIR